MIQIRRLIFVSIGALCLAMVGSCSQGSGAQSNRDCQTSDGGPAATPGLDAVSETAVRMVNEGRQTFRFDTFGDEDFWTNSLQLNRAIAGAAHGGVGDGVTPKTALSVGLKVDVDALPAEVVNALKNNQVNLDDSSVTLTLLQANAVVGVTGKVGPDGSLASIGIQCALCHSTVDDSLAPGIGHRLDGWPNRDLNVGAVINLSPTVAPIATLLGVSEDAVRQVLLSWGPGKFDAEVFLDGKAVNPNTQQSGAVLIPPAFGLAGVNLHTWTGWGSVTYWNAFVANLEMHGKGTFFDPRLQDATKFPIAAANHLDDVRNSPDLITDKLAALHFYQLALVAPTPPASSFDAAAAGRGKTVFEGKAKCATCHVPPLFTEPGWNMHTADEVGVDSFQADRAPDNRYRTSPLKGLFTHMKGGFYHDGRFATLADVIDHYDSLMSLGLSGAEKSDLAEYLKSL